jgi:hypothetical protein
MIRYTRGSRVVIQTLFRDTSGDIAEPSSVEIEFTYKALLQRGLVSSALGERSSLRVELSNRLHVDDEH